MSTTAANPEPGWYHAPGDEPGTVRLWNGTAWVGFPQRDPNVPLSAAPKPFERIDGQVVLQPFAVLAKVALGAMTLVYAIGAIAMWFVAATVDPADLVSAEASSAPVASSAAESSGGILESILGIALFGFWITVVFAPVLFLIWMWRAYANMALWRENTFDTFWAAVAWFVPFINLRRPFSIVMELMEHSPSKEDEGAINPVLGVVWWVLYIVPGFIWTIMVFGAASDVTDIADNPDAFTSRVLLTVAVTLTMSALSLVCLIMIITRVTHYQDRRRRPTEAQAEYYGQDQAKGRAGRSAADATEDAFTF